MHVEQEQESQLLLE